MMESPEHYLHSLDSLRGPELRHEQPTPPPRRKRRGWRLALRRTIVVILTLFIVTLLSVGGLAWYHLSKLSINPLTLGPLAQTDGRTNVLILGTGDPGHAGEKLTDTILVLSIDHTSGKVAMVSVPRDLRVRVSGYGFSKVNAANAYGGAALAQQTIANTLGIPIHYYLTTNFKGLAQAVDAVGGLDVTVKERLYDSEYPCDDNQYKACGIDIAAGNYHMDGALALKYSRCRKGTCGNDFGRAARQQEIIQKLRDKVSTPAVYLSPTTDAALLGAVSSNSQTNMSANNLLELAWDLKGSKQTINFVLSTSPGGFLRGDPAGSSDLLPLGGDFSDIQDYVKNIFTLPVPESAIR